MNATVTLPEITVPPGVTVLDDFEEAVASITPPTAEPVEEDIETETELVGEGEAQAEGDTAEEAAESASADEES
jgi:large subunit ribosomal protein L25